MTLKGLFFIVWGILCGAPIGMALVFFAVDWYEMKRPTFELPAKVILGGIVGFLLLFPIDMVW